MSVKTVSEKMKTEWLLKNSNKNAVGMCLLKYWIQCEN